MLNQTPLRQSNSWASFLQTQGWDIKEEKSKGNAVLIFIKKLPFAGSVIKIQHQKNPLPIDTIESLAEKKRAIQTTIEPYTNFDQEKEFLKRGYKPSKNSLIPTKTILIDLRQSEEEILSQMHYSGRRGIRSAEKENIQTNRVELTDENLQTLALALSKVAKRQNFKAVSFQTLKNKVTAFGNEASLFFAYKNNSFLGAVLALATDNTLHYHHAATTKLGREKYAAYLLIQETLFWGKKENYTTFDFGGIADTRIPKTSSWQGFTEFKNKFGGHKIEWPLPLVKWRIPLSLKHKS